MYSKIFIEDGPYFIYYYLFKFIYIGIKHQDLKYLLKLH